jgi:hypothetical protein
MSSRGRRSHSHLRRPTAPLGAARAARTGLASSREGNADRFFEIDPLDELDRILGAKPQRFRLQFFAVAGDHGPSIVLETEIEAADAAAATRSAAEADWPPQAIGVRILDREGREIFERLRADRR